MDVEKLLVQENPPTRKEWCALRQGIRNWTLYALVDLDADMVQYIQLKPYTAMQLVFDVGDDVGKDMLLGVGFSKVCHPDVYDAVVGDRIARIRAVRMIVKQLLNAQPATGYDLVVAKAYDVLVAKWDRYLLALDAVRHAVDPAAEGECKSAMFVHDEYFTGAEDAESLKDAAAKLEAELGPYADFTLKHPAMDAEAEVGIDSAEEGGDESIDTILVRTMP